MTDDSKQDGDHSAGWPYEAHMPQRYAVNRDRYLARGGLVRPEEDVKGFVGGGRNRGDMARFYSLCLILDQLDKERLDGDIAELGVYKGDTATIMASIARRLGKTAYLLDTFEGFSANDLIGVDADIKMEFADTSLESVRSLVGENSVKYIKGYFPQTASALPDNDRYCLVHIDCDLYAPMMNSLQYFYPRLVEGGYIMMHDYTSLHWDGAEKAIDEFFADKPESVIALPDGAGTAVVRRAKTASRLDNWLLRKRRSVLNGEWIDVTKDRFADLLGSGWSHVESWGVWGIGEAHEIQVVLPPENKDTLLVEAEGNAVLIGERIECFIDVVAGEKVVATWHFTRDSNLGVRQAVITNVAPADLDLPTFSFGFRPRGVEAPHDLDPSSTMDTRRLGFGLHRLRLTLV